MKLDLRCRCARKDGNVSRKRRPCVLNVAILTLVFAAAAQSTEIEKLRLAAEQGNADAQVRLGIRYGDGVGVPEDYQEAVRWYCLAAEQGDAEGQVRLGFMYYNGRGVRKDYIQAHKWFNLAASQATPREAGDYRSARRELAEDMTAPQVDEAQRRARQWQPKSWEQLKGNPEGPCSNPSITCSPLDEASGLCTSFGATQPVILHQSTPSYSAEALEAKIEGTVSLEAIVRRDGTVEVVRVIRSLGFGLEEEAIRTVSGWRFQPGTQYGDPVDVPVTIEVEFNLR